MKDNFDEVIEKLEGLHSKMVSTQVKINNLPHSIAVVDDQVEFLELLSRQVKESGSDHTVHLDGSGLRSLVNPDKYTTLVLDVRLAEGSSIDMIEAIKDDISDKVDICFTSAEELSSGDMDRIKALGCRFKRKPDDHDTNLFQYYLGGV